MESPTFKLGTHTLHRYPSNSFHEPRFGRTFVERGRPFLSRSRLGGSIRTSKLVSLWSFMPTGSIIWRTAISSYRRSKVQYYYSKSGFRSERDQEQLMSSTPRNHDLMEQIYGSLTFVEHLGAVCQGVVSLVQWHICNTVQYYGIRSGYFKPAPYWGSSV